MCPFAKMLADEAERSDAACLYFPRIAAGVNQVVSETVPSFRQVDEYLVRGWRRFGNYYFRDDCPDCSRCVPLRVVVDSFQPGKRQRRILRRASHLDFRIFSIPEFADRYLAESYNLYKVFRRERYGIKDSPFREFLYCYFLNRETGVVSALFDSGKLVGCGWLDRGLSSLSTVYFVFDPDYSSFSPGILSILLELQWASGQGISRYYLGYWLKELSSMAYKGAFRPAEILDYSTGDWSPMDWHHP